MEYNYDPCCFELPAWYEVCSPQMHNETVKVIEINNDKVDRLILFM